MIYKDYKTVQMSNDFVFRGFMGRWGSKEEADGLKKIQVWWLKQHGYLEPHWMKSGGIQWSTRWSENKSSISFQASTLDDVQCLRLTYTHTGPDGVKTDYDYKIPLTTTPCYFGGFRYWFRCPWYANGVYCGRRVGVLYLGGKYFACRHCYDLTYKSRKLSGLWKTAGSVISIPELEEIEATVKRKWYAGKMTKKYQSYLKKEWKSMRQMKIMADGLSLYKKLEKT